MVGIDTLLAFAAPELIALAITEWKKGKATPSLEALKKFPITLKCLFRVRLKKFVEYVEMLKAYGTYIGEPVVKKLVGTEFWELRPTRDRIIFIHIIGDKFLFLNHFVKKTEKTPTKEIEKARRMLADYLERSKKI